MEEQIINSEQKAEGVLAIPSPETIVSSGIMVSGMEGFHKALELRRVDYTIRDVNFPDFNVLETANAWWNDRAKVERLLVAFKAGHMIKDACFYAGISKDQWQYFNEVHPDFSSVQEACESYQTFGAMDALNDSMRKDGHLALQFLRIRHPMYKKEEKVDTPLVQQTVQVAVSQNVDTTKIEEILTEAARNFLGQDAK